MQLQLKETIAKALVLICTASLMSVGGAQAATETVPLVADEESEPLNAGQVIVRDVSHKVNNPPAAADRQVASDVAVSDSAETKEPVPATAAAPVSTAPTATAPGAHDAHAGPPAVPAEKALGWLKNGNTRFVKKHFRKDGRSEKDRTRLVKGQNPHTIVLSCSDSRVPPETVFDQVPGEIFVIRVAGEALDSSVLASIEYAIEHLGTRLIVVMGHTSCGAVSAAIHTKEGESAGSPDLDRLVADIRPRLKVTQKDKPSPNLEVESAVNADGVARDLVKRSSLIRAKVEAGSLTIKPALYRLDTGKVSFY